ncbi:MAG: non-hydrolyzing UDP-N-acetylglucosamine 2-epimerase [Thermoleophilia bacterium]
MHIVGTRPNFMKVAPIMAAVDAWDTRARGDRLPDFPILSQVLVHTGQHYDEKMSTVFFSELGLPKPDHYLGVGSGTHAETTARVMLALEPVILAEQPDVVVVVGDVNSTLAAALVAAKLRIPVVHVEAGLRSGDRDMPEELNRLVTDQMADLLFTTSRDADENLKAEGIPADRVVFVGNTMIDSLERHRRAALQRPILADLHVRPHEYGVVTLHRPSNVDSVESLARLVAVFTQISRQLPLVFPIHARTRRLLEAYDLLTRAEADGRVILAEPLGYLDFLCLLAQARLVLTDSGGIQEETTVLGVPCLTLRKNTERPVTIWEGTNRLVDPEDPLAISDAASSILRAPRESTPRRPELWDGRAGDRIIEAIVRWLA